MCILNDFVFECHIGVWYRQKAQRSMSCNASSKKSAVIIVDHGSRRKESNEQLDQFIEMYRQVWLCPIFPVHCLCLCSKGLSHFLKPADGVEISLLWFVYVLLKLFISLSTVLYPKWREIKDRASKLYSFESQQSTIWMSPSCLKLIAEHCSLCNYVPLKSSFKSPLKSKVWELVPLVLCISPSVRCCLGSTQFLSI